MPSPIAHWTVGLVVCRFLWPGSKAGAPFERGAWPWLLATSLVLALLPDATSVIGLVTGEFARYHNSWEHSLAVGVACALLGAGVVRLLGLGGGWRWFFIVLLCFELHVLMDLFTVGRGVKLLWPLSDARISPPFKLFYGLHWSDGWLSFRHFWTVLSEAALAGVIAVAASAWWRRRRSSTVASPQGHTTKGT